MPGEDTARLIHLAVPLAKDIDQATRIPATASGRRLSDHDAYIVDLADTD